jgi:hypothetical protein
MSRVTPDPIISRLPVGETVQVQYGDWGDATATFDASNVYRYRLSRIWDASRSRIVWIMLNPSSATAAEVDPTINRILRFSKRWGHGAAEVVNLFALRATDPTVLKRHFDPVGPRNDEAIMAAVGFADRVVVAWGTRGVLNRRDEVVAGLTRKATATVEVLGLTMAGHPRHPLYIAKTTQPYPWMV